MDKERLRRKIIEVAPSTVGSKIAIDGFILEIEIPFYADYEDVQKIEKILRRRGYRILTLLAKDRQIKIICRR